MPITDLVKSPQERALENIIWDRLSAFWTDAYDPSDKDALNAMYDSFLKVLDSEYVRLFQIDDNKSLYSAPIYTQRRWVRLDLNRYDTLKKWFKFLVAGDPTITTNGAAGTSAAAMGDGTGLPGGSNDSSCGVAATNHTRHWHIAFPWKMVNDLTKSLADRQTLELSLPIFQALTKVWKLDAQGLGTLLAPGIDYIIGSNGKSIRVIQAAPSHRYEFEVAFDLGEQAFTGQVPRMVAPLGFQTPGTLLLPTGFGNGLPVHVMILRNPPAMSVSQFDGTVLGTATNTPFYTTERIFIPYSYGTDAGISYKNKTQVTLPAGVTLNANDIVLMFGLAEGTDLPNHQHIHSTRDIVSNTPISTVSLYEYSAVPPVFGAVGLFANEFRLTVNGKFISPNEYQFDSATGQANFKSPKAPNANNLVHIDLEYTNESISTEDSADTSGHLHYVCTTTVTSVPEVFETFDDGGIYDDDIDLLATFDSVTAVNSVVFDITADLATMNVYLQGILLESGSNYTASLVGTGSGSQVRIFFAQPIKGRTIVVTYRAPSLIVQIGGADLTRATGVVAAGTNGVASSNRYGITQNVLNNLAANFVQLTTAFKTAYGVSDADMQRLIEAAYIASVGGNPVLVLFFDEFPEYSGLPIDAKGLVFTAAQTRAIECSGTDFVDIPYMQDHVLSPTIRLFSGVDYVVDRGELAGSQALLRKRGPDDATPGQWWVPLLVLDEQFLSRNFGALVGDLRTSDKAYRDALAANFRLRYQGATSANLHRVLCAYLGSPAFQSDARVSGYSLQANGFVVTLTSSTGDTQESFNMQKDNLIPSIGQHFFPGQSLRGSVVYDKQISGLVEYGHGFISLTDDVHLLTRGDTVRLQMRDPVYGGIAFLTFTVASVDVVTNSAVQRYRVQFSRATNFVPFSGAKLRAYRDHGAPYAAIDGSITAVDPVFEKYLNLSDGSRYRVNRNAPEVFAIGQQIYRGDPLDPSLALVYDDVSRPNWHRYSASAFQAGLVGKVQFDDGLLGSGYVTITANGDDYAYVVISPTPDPLPRGTRLQVVLDVDATHHHLEIGGPGTNPGEYYAKTDLTGNRVLTGTVQILSPARLNAQYIEIATGTATSPTLTVVNRVLVGTSFLSVTDTTQFPTRGRCQITLLDGPIGGPGSTLEFAYDGKNTYELHNLKWGSRDTIENEAYVGFSPQIQAGCVITLISRFADNLVNPAFQALVKVRARHPGNTNAVVVSAESAEQLYPLLKGTATVIETSVMTHPQPLLDAIAEATPVGSTTVIFAKQVITDHVDLSPSDSPAIFQTPTLDLLLATPVGSPIEPGNIPVIWLSPDIMSVGLTTMLNLGALTPPPGKLQLPFIFKWTIAEEVNVSQAARVTDTSQETLRIDFMDPESILYVKVKATDPITYTSVSDVTRIRRFNTPAMVIKVTNPTTGTMFENSDWEVPSPSPSLDLAAILDPAVPSSAVGPYVYSWAVIDEALNPAPTILNGATATPTLTGVANNAVLRVTLTVTATGLPVGTTRDFIKVVHIRLV